MALDLSILEATCAIMMIKKLCSLLQH